MTRITYERLMELRRTLTHACDLSQHDQEWIDIIDRLAAIERQVKELVCQHEAAALSNRESAEQCTVSDEIKHRWLGMAEAQETGARLLRAIIDALDAGGEETCRDQ